MENREEKIWYEVAINRGAEGSESLESFDCVQDAILWRNKNEDQYLPYGLFIDEWVEVDGITKPSEGFNIKFWLLDTFLLETSEFSQGEREKIMSKVFK